MIGEILIIIGLALITAYFIGKMPQNKIIDSYNRKLIEKNNEMNTDNIKPKSLLKKIADSIKNIFISIFSNIKKRGLKRHNRLDEPQRLFKTDPVTGKTVFPSSSNETTDNTGREEIETKNPLKIDNEFWSEVHRVEKKPMIKKQTSNAFAEAEELFSAKNFQKAEQLYIQAATEDPDNHKIFNRLGAIYMEQKNYIDAIDAFKAAVDLDPGIASRHYNLAVAHIAHGDKSRAKKSLATSVELEPTNTKYRKLLDELS